MVTTGIGVDLQRAIAVDVPRCTQAGIELVARAGIGFTGAVVVGELLVAQADVTVPAVGDLPVVFNELRTLVGTGRRTRAQRGLLDVIAIRESGRVVQAGIEAEGGQAALDGRAVADVVVDVTRTAGGKRTGGGAQ